MPIALPEDPDHPAQTGHEYPALAALGLTADDIAALARQGFVAKEKRNNSVFAKLRFRRNGRQVVRYVGSAEKAEEVQRELSVLQEATKNLRQLGNRITHARKLLKHQKTQLEPLLAAQGFTFHGLAIRRTRRRHGSKLPSIIKEIENGIPSDK